MGTSLCLAAAPWPTLDGVSMSHVEIIETLTAQAQTLGPVAAEELCDQLGGTPEEVLDGEQLSDLTGWVRGMALEAIEYLFADHLDASHGFFPRDVTFLTLDKKVWIFGGGGDGGDGYDAIVTLSAVGLL